MYNKYIGIFILSKGWYTKMLHVNKKKSENILKIVVIAAIVASAVAAVVTALVIWKKKKKGCCSDEDIDNLIDEKLNENEADESESE